MELKSGDEDSILREDRFRYRFPVKQIERSRLIQRWYLRALLATFMFSFCPMYSTICLLDLSPLLPFEFDEELTLLEYLELIFLSQQENEIIVITADRRYDIWSFARRLIIIITWESHCSIETILQLFFPSFFFTKKKI